MDQNIKTCAGKHQLADSGLKPKGHKRMGSAKVHFLQGLAQLVQRFCDLALTNIERWQESHRLTCSCSTMKQLEHVSRGGG